MRSNAGLKAVAQVLSLVFAVSWKEMMALNSSGFTKRADCGLTLMMAAAAFKPRFRFMARASKIVSVAINGFCELVHTLLVFGG